MIFHFFCFNTIPRANKYIKMTHLYQNNTKYLDGSLFYCYIIFKKRKGVVYDEYEQADCQGERGL